MNALSIKNLRKTYANGVEALKGVSMRALFEKDGERAARFSMEAAGLFLDYSKNKITDDVADHLIALAMALFGFTGTANVFCLEAEGLDPQQRRDDQQTAEHRGDDRHREDAGAADEPFLASPP